MTYRKED